MSTANIRRLIGVAAPLWAGEAEVVSTYWSSPKRTRDTDLAWLRRQCFKEFWGSGVSKYDRGGVVLGQLKERLFLLKYPCDVSTLVCQLELEPLLFLDLHQLS